MGEKMTLEPCKECGSKDVSWSCAPRNNGQAADGRICMREVGMQFYRGCDSCGETLEVIGADEFLAKLNAHLTQPAQAVDVGAAQEVLVEMERVLGDVPNWRPVIDMLTAALPNANGKEGVGRDFTEEVDADGKATGYLIFEHTTPPMLPDEVRKAVEDIEFRLRGVWEPQADVHADFAAIKAHLLAREADVEGMRTLLDLLRTDNNGKKYHCIVSRAGSVVPVEEIITGTAHLSENSRG